MLAEIDTICAAAGVWPDLFLSGHAHNYQRYTRTKAGKKIPFIVAGTGGHGLGAVPDPSGQTIPECTYEKAYMGWGYLLLEALHVPLRHLARDAAAVRHLDLMRAE